MGYFLFPAPRRAVFRDRKFDYSNAGWIKVYAGADDIFKEAALDFTVAASECFPDGLELCAGGPSAGSMLLEIFEPDSSLGEQQYRMSSSKHGISLRGGSAAALFYGLQTLRQLLPQCGVFVPEFDIDDSPDFGVRGFMLDVSRCKVPKMDELLEFVELLASLKYNQLQLYIEHTFAFAAHSDVWAEASPFSAAEILRLDLFCKRHYIELAPNLNSFGHLERWLRHEPYKHLAECPSGFSLPNGITRPHGGVLKPNDGSLEFLDSLYREYLPNFSSRNFNIGCDETWELGQGWSRDLCAEKGSTRVYFDFLLNICDLSKKHGCRPMFWGDIILHQPDLIGELPAGITALNWGYEADHPFADEGAAFARSGVPFYVCPGTSAWNSISGRTDNCLDNILSAAVNGSANGAAGFLMTDWGDGGHHQYAPVSWVGICAGGAYSWCHEVNRHADIGEAIDVLIANDSAGVLGDYLLEFGRLCNVFGKKPKNSTVYNRALFTEKLTAVPFVEDFSVDETHKAMRRLLELRGHLASAAPGGENGRLIIEELMNASLMVECGLCKMLMMKGEKIDIPALRSQFRLLIGKHEELWMRRNRSGGLHESSASLRKAMAALDG